MISVTIKKIAEMITKASTIVLNTRNTISVTKLKVAVPRTEIRRHKLCVHMQLQDNGLFRMILFLTYILMQSESDA